MSLLRVMRLTPSQAKELSHDGFIVELIRYMCGEQDEYKIYVRS